MKKARDEKLQQAEVVANNKIQFEVSAKLQKERERDDKEARHEVAQIRVDALRHLKLTQSLAESSEREALANQRLQADMAAKVRGFWCLACYSFTRPFYDAYTLFLSSLLNSMPQSHENLALCVTTRVCACASCNLSG